jgi:ADP-ribose pyrophosphatase
MQPWKTLSRRIILDHSKYLRVESHAIRLPDGRVLPDWPWIITPDFVIVLARTEDGRFLVFRQTKYAVAGTTLAPVGGQLEKGEDPLVAAQRELLEETGHRANKWISLGSYRTNGNNGGSMGHLFLALDAQYAQTVASDDLEEQELLYLSKTELENALQANEFKVLAWAATVSLALQHLTGNRT